MTDRYIKDVSQEAKTLIESNNFYFNLTDEEVNAYCTLAGEGAALPEMEAIRRLAELSVATDESDVYWATIECLWGFVNRISDNNNEDIERKNRLKKIFKSISPGRGDIFGNAPQYNQLVNTVLKLKEKHETAAILAFGIFIEMDNDYLFWEDLFASIE